MKKLLAAVAAIAALVFLAAGLAVAQPGEYKDITWADLVPKGWDPMKRFRDSNVGPLSDTSPKVMDLMREMRTAWDNAPTLYAMDNVAVRLPGYIVPLQSGKEGLTEFLLVPYFGACIHTPPPPANQIIHVLLGQPAKGLKAMDAVWVSGVLKNDRQPSDLGVSGYKMDEAAAKPYGAKR